MMTAVAWLTSHALGVERPRARCLLVAMRARRGLRDYWARVVLFAIGVSPLGRLLGPRRPRALAPLVFKLLDRPADAMYFLGAVAEPVDDGCRGMLAE